MNRRARLFFDGTRHTWEVALYDNALTSHQDAKLYVLEPPVREVGKTGEADPIPPLLPTRVEMPVLDVGRALTGAMEDRPDTDFRLQLRRDGELYFEGVAYLKSRDDDGVANPVRRLVAYDGLTLLKSASFDPAGTRSIARWMYDILSQGAVQRGLHTYSSWQAAAQAGAALQGLFAKAAPFTDEKTPWQHLRMICRAFGLQLGTRKEEYLAVQRSYRSQASLSDAPEGAGAENRDFRVTLLDSHLVRRGGPCRPPQFPAIDPARSVQVRWMLNQEAHVNGQFDHEQGPLWGWNFSGISVVQPDDRTAIRHDTTSDYITQRFNAPPLEGAKVILDLELTKGAVANPAARVNAAQLRFHDIINGTTYSLDSVNGWVSGTSSYFARPVADVRQQTETVIPALPGSGIGYFEVETFFDPDPDSDGTNEYGHMDVFGLYFEPAANGYESATYSAANQAGSQREVEITTMLGGLDTKNALDGALRIDQGGTVAEDFDASTSGRQPFLSELVRDVGGQQVQKLRGLDVWLGPTAPEVDAFSTIQYDGVTYVPVYEKEIVGRSIKRIVAYELRSDAVGTISTEWAAIGAVEEDETGQPVAKFTTAVTDQTVDVDASASYDPDGSLSTYEWDWRDGSTSSVASATTNHTYSEAGTFTITLTVIDEAGNTGTYSKNVTIENDPPSAAFTTSANETLAFGVNCDASGSSDPDGEVIRYDWDWGDGSETLQGDVQETHQYSGAGTYTITLTVTDNLGKTDVLAKNVNV